MFAEAREAGDAVATQLATNGDAVAELGARLRRAPPHGVITFARGSSDHAATFGKYLIETRAHRIVASAGLSIASVYQASPASRGMLAVGISQSGASPDILAGMKRAQEGGADTLALVNVVDSPLARMASECLGLHAGPERSVAATKSYIAALSSLTQIVGHWADDAELLEALAGAPDLLREAWRMDWSPLVEMLRTARGLYVIGRGTGLAIAQEAALKFKETCGLHAEAFSAAELHHGPMALVGPDFPLLVFRQNDETGEGIDALVADLRARDAPVLVASSSCGNDDLRLPVPAAHPVIEPMLHIQAFYRAIVTLSVSRGFDPDHPPHLAKVTETI